MSGVRKDSQSPEEQYDVKNGKSYAGSGIYVDRTLATFLCDTSVGTKPVNGESLSIVV